jgi:hypothetical protein
MNIYICYAVFANFAEFANSSTSMQTRHPVCKPVNEYANSVPYCHAVFANLAEFTNPSTCLPTINRHVVNSNSKRRRVCTNLILQMKNTFSNTWMIRYNH